MKTSHVAIILVVAGAILAGCGSKEDQAKKQKSGTPEVVSGGSAIAGIHWMVPQGWAVQPEKPMRVATYTVPAAGEGAEAGECAVFYFGSNQGGSVNDNLSRWISQFETGGKHEFSAKEINGLKTTLVEITGTYLSPSGPAMESQGKKPNYQLLGAIVEAPQGLVFFKLTGPQQTIKAAVTSFNDLVNSISKDQTAGVPR